MGLEQLADQGLVLVGCGKMGSALLAGWRARGVPEKAMHVLDPAPSDWLRATGVTVNGPLPTAPAVVLLAVKPQMMAAALPGLRDVAGPETVFVSIAAGTTIAQLADRLGAQSPIIRAMPNTPAAVGAGITALSANAHASTRDRALAEALLGAVGRTVWLDHESQMDAVTALSGSGPAYVFHLIEAMAAAGQAQGLSADLAMVLARETVIGAGRLAAGSDETAARLRINVTSPGGTTAAALSVLMDTEQGLPPLMERAIAAAAQRAKDLSA
ncbi:MAG: pyrroline-5-carboxylate reductase [Roseinatronobacter sp.]